MDILIKSVYVVCHAIIEGPKHSFPMFDALWLKFKGLELERLNSIQI